MEPAGRLFEEISLAGLQLDNTWKIRQNNALDSRTGHIYSCPTIAELNDVAAQKALNDEEQFYAVHRWRNFKRHEAWLSLLFEQVPMISLTENEYDKKQDFYIESNGVKIPFDLKVTRYPMSVSSGMKDADLAEWFYKNQSTQGRFHLANRFFVVGQPEASLYDIHLGRLAVKKFVTSPSRFRHFIAHSSGERIRAVILRCLPLTA